MLSMPYKVYRPIEIAVIPNLHVQNSEDVTITAVTKDGMPHT